MLITFVYQKLLHDEISKNALRSRNFHFFPNFVVTLKAFELTCDCSILYFPITFTFPV